MTTTILRVAGALAVPATVLLVPSPAAALSCAGPGEWLPSADHVFVGRVSDVRGEDVQFSVTEVWAGPDLAPQVWFPRDTELEMWFPFSGPDGEVPDGWSGRQEYVVGIRDGRPFNPCNLFERGQHDFAVAEPDAPWQPVAGGDAGVEPSPEPRSAAMLGGALLAALGGGLAWWWRSRS